MRATTIKRHKAVRDAYNALPPMPAMKAYVQLGERFCLSDERIRKILAKKHPPQQQLVILTNNLPKKAVPLHRI